MKDVCIFVDFLVVFWGALGAWGGEGEGEEWVGGCIIIKKKKKKRNGC